MYNISFSMNNINDELNKHFKKLKIKKNDHILIYSKLSSFGIIDKDFSKNFLNFLINYIGPKGTIIMPCYIFEKKDFVFNIKKLKKNYSTSMLVKEFFKVKKTRSKRLIHSHIGLGQKADILKKEIDTSISLGKKSDFDLMTKANFKCVYIGCNANEAGTYLIHLEHLNKVPYRNKLVLTKKIIENNTIKKVKINYSQRPKNIKIDYNYAFSKLRKLGAKINIANLKFGKSYSINLKEFSKFGNIMLKKDKYSFIKK